MCTGAEVADSSPKMASPGFPRCLAASVGFLLALVAFSDPLRDPEDCRWLNHVQYGLLFPTKKVTWTGNVVVTRPVATCETGQVPLKYSLNGP